MSNQKTFFVILSVTKIISLLKAPRFVTKLRSIQNDMNMHSFLLLHRMKRIKYLFTQYNSPVTTLPTPAVGFSLKTRIWPGPPGIEFAAFSL